jgi:hypothetical protein
VGEEMKFILFSLAIQAEVTGIDQNGVAERAHKTIYDQVGPTLASARLPSKFWPEIARTAAFLYNRSPSSKLSTTPYQAWYGKKPDLSRLRVIGSRGTYLIPPKQRNNLIEPKIRPCILLGYEGNNNYRILLEDGRIVGTPNAKFHITTPSIQSTEDIGAKGNGSPEVTVSAAGGSRTVGFQSQLPEQMSPQSSDGDSQPHIAEQEERTLSPIWSDDTFRPFSDALQGDDPLSDSDQQQDDARQDQTTGEWLRYPELQTDRPVHAVTQEVLESHPELKLRTS